MNFLAQALTWLKLGSNHIPREFKKGRTACCCRNLLRKHQSSGAIIPEETQDILHHFVYIRDLLKNGTPGLDCASNEAVPKLLQGRFQGSNAEVLRQMQARALLCTFVSMHLPPALIRYVFRARNVRRPIGNFTREDATPMRKLSHR